MNNNDQKQELSKCQIKKRMRDSGNLSLTFRKLYTKIHEKNLIRVTNCPSRKPQPKCFLCANMKTTWKKKQREGHFKRMKCIFINLYQTMNFQLFSE